MEIDYTKLNTYNYFLNYSAFLKQIRFEQETNTKDKNINVFIECLCRIYIAHNIHYKIKEEISKKTNLFILKGDYLFSLGYLTVCKIGNPLLIKYYSKISEHFAKVRFVT